MTECAWCATRTKGTYFSARYQRLAARRGKKRALVAIAANVSHTLKSDALTAAIKAGREAESAALDRIAAISREIEAAEPATAKTAPVTHDASSLIELAAGMTGKGKGKAKRAAA